jgi:hypothetical protein
MPINPHNYRFSTANKRIDERVDYVICLVDTGLLQSFPLRNTKICQVVSRAEECTNACDIDHVDSWISAGSVYRLSDHHIVIIVDAVLPLWLIQQNFQNLPFD